MTAVPLPATSYSTVVSLNVASQGWNVAYSEWQDSTNNFLRQDGHFAPTAISEVTKNGLIWRWDRHANPIEPCTVVNADDVQPVGFQSHPCDRMWFGNSTTFFECFAMTNATYQGITLVARGIPCELWIANYTLTLGRNFIFTFNMAMYYAQTNVFGTERYPVPVRAEVHGSRQNADEKFPIDAYWDWANWVAGTPDQSIFLTPASGCTSISSRSRFSIPGNNTVLPVASDIARKNPPLLPSQLAAVVEVVSSDSSVSVSAVWWHFSMPLDAASRYERIDYHDYSDNTDDTIVYQYIASTSTTSTSTSAGITYTIEDGTCTRGTISSTEVSPLSTYRAGFTPTLFTNPTELLSFQYLNRTFARGVMCDVYRRYGLSWSKDNKFYTFITDVYFFPEGFQFPGRSLPDNFRMPMRVVNTGSIVNNDDSSVQAYHDIWDFFLLNPGMQNYSDWFNVTAQCPIVFVPDFTISSKDAGATVAAIFGSLAGFACIVTVYNKFRRVQRMKRREHRKVLENLTNKGNEESTVQLTQQQPITTTQPDEENPIEESHIEPEPDDEYGVPDETEPQETYGDDEHETTEESVIAQVQHAASSGSRSPVR